MSLCLLLFVLCENPEKPSGRDAYILVSADFETMIRFPLTEEPEWRCEAFLAQARFATPRIGLASEWSVGDSAFGPFSATIEVEASVWGLGSPFCLYWYPCEEAQVSVRCDLLRRRLSWNTSGGPLVRRHVDELLQERK